MLQIIYTFFRHHLLNFQGKNPWRHFGGQGVFSMKNTKVVQIFVDN